MPDGEDPSLFHPDHLAAPYTSYEIQTSYVFGSGLSQQPVGADDDSGGSGGSGPSGTGPTGPVEARFVKVSAGCMQKVVSWTARRAGVPPVLPAPVPASNNEKLLNATICPSAPGLDADGQTQLFEVSGTYTFGLRVPVWYTAGIPMGTVPYALIYKEANVLPVAAFSTDLI